LASCERGKSNFSARWGGGGENIGVLREGEKKFHFQVGKGEGENIISGLLKEPMFNSKMFFFYEQNFHCFTEILCEVFFFLHF
jgi:hypothetical protein